MDELNSSRDNTRASIQLLVNELHSFSKNDLLVQFSVDQVELIPALNEKLVFEDSPIFQKLYKVSTDLQKETGASVFCLANGLLEWDYLGIKTNSPLFICPAKISHDKIRKTFEVTIYQDESFINPFLQNHFQKQFEINLSELLCNEKNVEDWNAVLIDSGFNYQIQELLALGNFHHHRFSILRDLEQIAMDESTIQTNLIGLLEGKLANNQKSFILKQRLVLPANECQLELMTSLSEQNVVVQGPPGTGKSQLITNLIGRTLHDGYKTLAVSEKRVALEVIQQRLESCDLGRFAFLPEGYNASKQLIQLLRENWKWMEEYQPSTAFNMELSHNHLQALQLKLSVLAKEDLIGGVSYAKFKEMSKHLNLKEAGFSGNTASIQEFLKNKTEILGLYEAGLQKLISSIPHHLIREDRMVSLENNIVGLEKKYRHFQIHFDIQTQKDIAILMRRASFAQLMSNEIHQPYFRCLNPSKSEFKRFNKNYKKFLKQKKELELFEDQLKNWKLQPSKEEAIGLLQGLDEGGFFKKIKLKRKLKLLLQSPYIDAREALTKWLAYSAILEEKLKLETVLLALGLQDEKQMEWVQSMQLKIKNEDYEIWRNQSSVENSFMAEQNVDLHILYQNLRSFIHLNEEDSIPEFFEQVKARFGTFVEFRTDLEQLSEPLYKQIGQNASFEELEASILKSSWTKFISQYPNFKNFSIENLEDTISEIIALQDKEYKDFAIKTKNRIFERWNEYQKLLQIGTKKLSREKRLLKEKLKAGRSILIKEFGKTRSHPSLRELMQGEASIWIEVLLPVWMLNPSQVADSLPLKEEKFDFVLFDEATQIPLAHSLGAIQRGKRIMVVGDAEQMTPQYYFKSGESEPIDLLHQASFIWKKGLLKHHYRSENPQLIAFSNQHFYHNQLLAFPSPNLKPAVHKRFVADGVYEERINKGEAEELLKGIRPLLKSEAKIGVVAFSESQLQCIFNAMEPNEKELVLEKTENGQMFCKAIENVQGDECDHLFISFGYGPNPEGKILLNFGPLNKRAGRRRLNVLLTRARKSIDFYTSLQASDLVISQNDSLNLLRQFFQFCEKPFDLDHVFPYELQGQIQGTQVKFTNIFENIKNASELTTFHRALQERGWQVQYQ